MARYLFLIAILGLACPITAESATQTKSRSASSRLPFTPWFGSNPRIGILPEPDRCATLLAQTVRRFLGLPQAPHWKLSHTDLRRLTPAILRERPKDRELTDADITRMSATLSTSDVEDLVAFVSSTQLSQLAGFSYLGLLDRFGRSEVKDERYDPVIAVDETAKIAWKLLLAYDRQHDTRYFYNLTLQHLSDSSVIPFQWPNYFELLESISDLGTYQDIPITKWLSVVLKSEHFQLALNEPNEEGSDDFVLQFLEKLTRFIDEVADGKRPAPDPAVLNEIASTLWLKAKDRRTYWGGRPTLVPVVKFLVRLSQK